MTEVVFISRPDPMVKPIVVARADTDIVPRVHDTVAWDGEVWIVLQVLFDYREPTAVDRAISPSTAMRLERVHVKVQRA